MQPRQLDASPALRRIPHEKLQLPLAFGIKTFFHPYHKCFFKIFYRSTKQMWLKMWPLGIFEWVPERFLEPICFSFYFSLTKMTSYQNFECCIMLTKVIMYRSPLIKFHYPLSIVRCCKWAKRECLFIFWSTVYIYGLGRAAAKHFGSELYWFLTL